MIVTVHLLNYECNGITPGYTFTDAKLEILLKRTLEKRCVWLSLTAAYFLPALWLLKNLSFQKIVHRFDMWNHKKKTAPNGTAAEQAESFSPKALQKTLQNIVWASWLI